LAEATLGNSAKMAAGDTTRALKRMDFMIYFSHTLISLAFLNLILVEG
jgi:hypothetical protein